MKNVKHFSILVHRLRRRGGAKSRELELLLILNNLMKCRSKILKFEKKICTC